MKSVLFAISFAAFVAISAGLECYKCRESVAGVTELPKLECLDAFIEEDTSSAPSDVEVETCEDGMKQCFKSISQSYQLGIQGKFISSYSIARGCLNDTQSDTDVKCEEGKSGQGYQAVCFCTGDKCNSAATTYASLVALLACLLLSYFH